MGFLAETCDGNNTTQGRRGADKQANGEKTTYAEQQADEPGSPPAQEIGKNGDAEEKDAAAPI